MKATVISYSLTGNNTALGRRIAAELGAEHIEIAPCKPRTIPMIAIDMLLGRMPEIEPEFEVPASDSLVLMVAPVWMGKIPSPLRTAIRRMRGKIRRYVYVSLCGGADGANTGIAQDLTKRINVKPLSVLEYPITDVLPDETAPTRTETSAYRASAEDVRRFCENAVQRIRSIEAGDGPEELSRRSQVGTESRTASE